jgi:hypothetical protein
MVGAVDDTAVRVKAATLESPVADAVTVTVPALAPRVITALAVPSFSVMVGDGLTVAAPTGLTVKLTITPEAGIPVLSTTFTTSGAANAFPADPLWLFPLIILITAGETAVGVSFRMRSLIESVT